MNKGSARSRRRGRGKKRRQPQSADRNRSRKIARALVQEALEGKVWALTAIIDATEGTVTGNPPPVDLNALFEEGLDLSEFLKRVKEAYEEK